MGSGNDEEATITKYKESPIIIYDALFGIHSSPIHFLESGLWYPRPIFTLEGFIFPPRQAATVLLSFDNVDSFPFFLSGGKFA